jgi:hypothetical protein
VPLTFEDLEKTPTFQRAWETVRLQEEEGRSWEHRERRLLDEVLKTQCYLLAIGEMIVSEQSQIDLITTDLTSIGTSLSTTDSNIATLIATLEADQPQADLTALKAESANLSLIASALANLAPTIVTPPVGTQAFDPISLLALYSYSGTAAVDTTQWTEVTDVTGPSGEVLYTYDADVANAAPTGAVAGVWVPFTGTLTPVSGPPLSGGVPVVTGISPTSGPAAGGTSVAITGSGFTGATAVDFGVGTATFTVTDDGDIVAIAPLGVDGTVFDITVTTPSGTSAVSAADQFTYSG